MFTPADASYSCFNGDGCDVRTVQRPINPCENCTRKSAGSDASSLQAVSITQLSKMFKIIFTRTKSLEFNVK